MSEPITTALRGLLCAKPKGDACWDAMDAVDAVHAALEAENAALRERVEELDNVGGSMHDGGSITDELRKWAHGFNDPWKSNEVALLAIADRIDAEHERACKMERGEGIRIAEEAALDEIEHEYVKLPLDADGVPIHVGDRVEGLHGENADATHLTVHEDGSWDIGTRGWVPHLLRHRHVPTFEDVLREMADRCYADEDEPRDRDAIVAEFAAKLRLAGGAE